MQNKLIVTLFVLSVFKAVGQVDIGLGVLPEDDNSVGFKQANIKLQLPVKLNKGTLINSFSFTNYNVNYENNQLLNVEELENFKIVSYSLRYLKEINNKWSYALFVEPTLSSNFDSSITFDDLLVNGGIQFNKTTNSSKLSLGFAINSNFGLTIPIPLINYSKKVSDQFSYTIGIPVTKAEYLFNKRNKVSLIVKPKGFVANISNSIKIDNEEAKKARLISVFSGLNFVHQIDDFWKIGIEGGYLLYSEYSLINEQDKVYEFNTTKGFYTGINLKFNLINKNKQ